MQTELDPRPIPPEQPLPTDCCGSGCPMCVLDSYDIALARYEIELAAWEARQRRRDAGSNTAS